MNLILFLAGVFLITFILGRLLEKIRIPWLFSALLVGLGLAAYNPFKEITSAPDFLFLAHLGMYFLLFIIGFELDLKEILASKKFIIKTTLVVIFAEALVGSLFVHYLLNVPWLTAVLLSLSFATVGEAVLLPILEEFKLLKTKLGQTILGIGVLDDVIEVVTIIAIVIILGGKTGQTQFNIWINLLILFSLFALVFIFSKLRHRFDHFHYKDIHSFFLIVLFFIFLFIGLGKFAESAALGALLAGIALKNIIPQKTLHYIESEIKTLAYGFLAPIFFLWVGLDVNFPYLIRYPLLILFFMIVIKATKLISSYLVGRKHLGSRKAILLGISLSVKFSTSVVIIKLLLEYGLISSGVYSIFIGTKIIFKFVIPFLLSYLITKWKIGFTPLKKPKRA